MTWFAIVFLQASAKDAQRRVIAVPSHSSTKVVAITVVQEENTIDHGVLSHPTTIEIRSGATVSNVSLFRQHCVLP